MLDVPKIDIRPDHLEIVQGILKKYVPLCEVWAFGSRAKWTAKEYSDLDLAIITDRPLSLDVSASLSDNFSESDLPYKVDVVDWATTSESFRKIIERDKVVVQEAENRWGMSEWRATTVGEFCPFIYGKALPERLRVPGSIPVISSAGVSGSHSEALVNSGGIVIGRKGTVGSVTLCKSPFWAIDTAFYIPDDSDPDRDLTFTYYLLKTLGLDRMNSDSAVPGLNRDNAHARSILVPPLEEQRAIAHILGTLDDKIELNRKQNETLEAMARALFKAWFVDFEPVRAKIEGRWVRGQSLPGLPAHLFDLFPDKLVESELGEIPDGWELTPLSEFSSLNPESWTKRTRPEVILYVDISNTKWGRIESVTKYEADDAPSRAQRVLRPQDTIIGTVRPGNGSYALISDENLTGSTGFAVLRPLRREYSEFVYLAATAPENIERLSNLADGGAYPAVRPEIVSATQVPYTCKELINEFSRQVNSMLAGIADNECTSRSLAQLRDTLLPKLISGELRVPSVMIEGII